MTSPAELLALYDSQQRLVVPEHPPAGVTFEVTDGVMRVTGRGEGFVETTQHLSLSGGEPADIPQRLERAGFDAQEKEAVLVGHTSDLLVARPLPAGVVIRETNDHNDIVGLSTMLSEVWNDDLSWLIEQLEAQLAAAPELTVLFVAEAEGTIVSGARIEFTPGSDFAGLWGGSTAPAWQGKGIYGALAAARAQRAQQRGVRFLQVDASPESSPILQRRGFVEITSTTPYIWSPSAPLGTQS